MSRAARSLWWMRLSRACGVGAALCGGATVVLLVPLISPNYRRGADDWLFAAGFVLCGLAVTGAGLGLLPPRGTRWPWLRSSGPVAAWSKLVLASILIAVGWVPLGLLLPEIITFRSFELWILGHVALIGCAAGAAADGLLRAGRPSWLDRWPGLRLVSAAYVGMLGMMVAAIVAIGVVFMVESQVYMDIRVIFFAVSLLVMEIEAAGQLTLSAIQRLNDSARPIRRVWRKVTVFHGFVATFAAAAMAGRLWEEDVRQDDWYGTSLWFVGLALFTLGAGLRKFGGFGASRPSG